jgi:drug/metabolite transporter (DMT)-like permease
VTTSPAASRTALLGAFAAIYLIWGSTYLGEPVSRRTLVVSVIIVVAVAIITTQKVQAAAKKT